MFWSKTETILDPTTTSIRLKRTTLWGSHRERKYLEQELPLPYDLPVGTIVTLTRRRPFWRWRFWTPLQSTFFILTREGRWVKFCRTFH